MNRLFFRTAITFLLAAGLAPAQDIFSHMDWDKLAAKAKEKTLVALDGPALKLATQFLSETDKNQAKVRKIASDLTGIYVRAFEFEKEGEYNLADIELAVSKIKGPGWQRIVDVSEKNERAGVYVKTDGVKVQGLVVVAAEPKELAVVHVIGTIDPSQLKLLGGNFGIPKMELNMPPAAKK